MTKNQPAFRFDNIIFCGLMALALLAHYYVLLRYSSNLPKGDDYWDILRFLSDYQNANSWDGKAAAMFAQHNEHRTTINRLIYTIMYEISGRVNFKVLMLIGDLSTIGMIVLIGAQFKRRQFFFFTLSLTAIFLLNLQSWASLFLAMTAISNYCVVFFALASIHALASKQRGGLFLAILFAFCSSFSQGNGLSIWPVGLICIFLEENDDRYRRLVIWSLAALACLALYFFHYVPPKALQISHDAKSVALKIRLFLAWFFTFVGSCWAFESNNVTLATFIGVIMSLGAMPAVVFLKRKSPVLAYFILFLLLSAAIASYSRFSAFPAAGASAARLGALSSRYRIYSVYLSCILLISCYLFLSVKRPDWHLIKIPILLIAMAHTITSYAVSFEPMRDTQFDFDDSMRLWLLTGQNKRFFGGAFIKDASDWAGYGISSKIWDPRDLFADALYFHEQKTATNCSWTAFKGSLSMSVIRNSQAAAGELIINDTPLMRRHLQHVIVCKERKTYIGSFLDTSRTPDGDLIFHFFKTDPVETADAIIFETSSGDIFKGTMSPQLPNR